MPMRKHTVAALTAATALLLSACGSSSSGSSTAAGDTTIVPGGDLVDYQAFASGDPTHIDPALADNTQDSQIARLLFDGLMKTDNSGAVKSAVALDATPTADAKTWTFKLRNDVLYDNGDKVLPSDFKFAWERVLDPAMGSRLTSRFEVIRGASAVESGQTKSLEGVVADDNNFTLTVALNYAFQDFPSVVSTTPFSPLDKKLFDADPSLSKKWESGVMVGNGAFKMAGPWEHDRDIKLLRNEKYYGGNNSHTAYLGTVDFKISKDLDSAYNDFDASEFGVGRVPPGRYEEASVRFGTDLLQAPLLTTEYWGFNLNDPTVGGPQNLKLRQAISLAINRKDIVTKLYGGVRRPAVAWAPPGLPGYQVTFDSGDVRTEQAKELLREWGKTPPTIKISFNAGAGHEDKAAIIAQNLKDAGINAVPDPIAQADYGKSIGTGKLQFFRSSWNADYPSYDNFIAPLFTSTGDSNVFGYKNQALDQDVSQARATADATARNALYEKAEHRVLDDQVVVPIDWSAAGIVAKSPINDLVADPLGYVNYADAWIRKS